jgi:hypothetical protein
VTGLAFCIAYLLYITPHRSIRAEGSSSTNILKIVTPPLYEAANVDQREERVPRAITPPAGIRPHEIANHIIAESPGWTTGTITRPSEERRVKLGQTTNANPRILNSADNRLVTPETGDLRGWLRKVRGR